ncbi:DUF2272 domain-containing protein [Variovorax dokdonensis]|uniref:DUF2272 domain-containing protein n=1 Tax=Variovorax dokdonensis TaxID=344883 RepID=A0ABT7NDM7_9BURK|nr:DUF2272 domain-containing protein [Variovorax dokdonensis]MDM0046048.1 DUF2272 domain-containing protein [Variovorax dokdonensis]
MTLFPGAIAACLCLPLLTLMPAQASPAPAPMPADAAAAACMAGASAPARPRALRMAQLAMLEHQAFGGQALDAEGRLITSGRAEAEDTRASWLDAAPWQRVVAYWRAVEPEGDRLPSQLRFGGLRPAQRWLVAQALDQASSDRLQGLGVGPDQGLSSSELRAAQVALTRVAVIDTPWSAAFISWAAREAGLAQDEFTFSAAHVDYAAAAWKAGAEESNGHGTRYALRACELATTSPRVGDLMCQTRAGAAELDRFDDLGRALQAHVTGRGGLPMHCDVVVDVDGQGFDTIGGNVLQSVTRRRIVFAPGTGHLDPSYLPQGCGAGSTGCVDRHMSRQPWSLLLQWR